MDHRCKTCFTNNYDKLLKKNPLSGCEALAFCGFFNRLLDNGEDNTSPEIQRLLHHKLRELNGVADPYYKEKQQSNRIAYKLYGEWKPKVLASDYPFNLALRLAIAGNIMDYGVDHVFDVQKTIKKSLHTDFAIDHSALLKQRIKEAKSILYLGDNAGEIVFDKLFIETIKHPNVIFAVKDGPILNDVTFEDADAVGMNEVAAVISNGYDASSTLLEKCSNEFLDVYHSADLIISKGQGNLEGLINQKDPRIFFLFMVKCDVIAEKIGVPKGSLAVFNNS
ncbi:MAG: ARMT1-like domain-containing protein [Bacteroidales bacterium]|nr:ARMT1-like domain-containing protein [Bacteroidales bacterium]